MIIKKKKFILKYKFYYKIYNILNILFIIHISPKPLINAI